MICVDGRPLKIISQGQKELSTKNWKKESQIIAWLSIVMYRAEDQSVTPAYTSNQEQATTQYVIVSKTAKKKDLRKRNIRQYLA